MIIAYDKNKDRIHIDDAKRGKKYYCQTCGEEVCIKRGNIKAHHFAHLSNSLCDGWHYDMSDWHRSWQDQFPSDNQEVVFEFNGKKHRADIFINNTIIEFQHSNIKKEEFEDRNNFYNSLGYNVIWIFDTIDSFMNDDIYKCSNEGDYLWNNSLFPLNQYNEKMVTVYLQEYNNIWKEIPNYKDISITNDELFDYAWLHHIDSIDVIVSQKFYSIGNKDLSDYEFINIFLPIKFMHDGIFDINQDMRKGTYNINDLSDELLTNKEYELGLNRFIWCPMINHFVNPCDECIGCSHVSEKNDRCKFRFEKILTEGFEKILNIKYSENGKVEYVDILKDKKRHTYNYEKVPDGIFTIKEAFKEKKNTEIIRLRNINTGWKVQITKYNYDMMLKNNKCYGKVQAPEIWNKHFSKNESEIFAFNKKEWVIIWRK